MDALVAAADLVAPLPRLRAAAAVPAAAPAVPPNTRLSEEERWSCVILRKLGKTGRDISDYLHVSERTVSRVFRRYQLTGKVGSGSRSGRPRCTDEETDTSIALVARVERFVSARGVKRRLELNDVSVRTVDRRLIEAGLHGRIAQHKRSLSEAERRKRLSFAEGYRNWTKERWEHVLFSDEKCFYGKGWCGQVWVRREVGTALDPDNTVDQRSHPVKINAWACFTAKGQGYMYLFNETMDAKVMKSILGDNLIPSAERLGLITDPPQPWFFLHDNDKKFKSRLVTEWVHTNGITVLDFPPYSPDLNPIENLWSIVAREVEKHSCETMEALQDRVAEEWDNVDKRHLLALAHSMPKRCQDVIDANGHYTSY